MNKQVRLFAERHLQAGEEIAAWVPACRDKKGLEGAAVLTTRRLVFYRKGMTSEKFEPWPIARVTSVESRRGMVFFDATIYTSGDTMELRMADKDRAAEFVQALQQAIHPDPAADAAAAPAAGATDPLAQLERLGALRDAGVVSDEEFAAKKAELLARM